MFNVKLNHVLFVFLFQVTHGQRRIKDGEALDVDKKYMVYFLKARISPQYYDSWLCGGALVSAEYIVTSAACVTDVKHLYAIAGYKKYITDGEINNDPCTKEKKKKIILTCTPKAYELKYEELEKWSYIDIAVVKVESPYDLTDASYAKVCSYTPEIIQINYETKFQEPGIDAVVLGWGHLQKWRAQGDNGNYNQEDLNYAPTLLQNKEDCKKHYDVYSGMDEVIDKYMICTFEKGNIDIKGDTIIKSPPTAQGCSSVSEKLRNMEPASCEGDEQGQDIVLVESTRRDGSNKTENAFNGTKTVLAFKGTRTVNILNGTRTVNVLNGTKTVNAVNATKSRSYSLSNDIYKNIVATNVTSNESLIDRIYKSVINSRRNPPTRRQGICQNDHGGPLVTWVGSHEVLIGVASVFKITEDYECIGPYLFTSTQCNGAFLDCILSSDPNKNNNMRRDLCDSPPNKKGFELIETHISWKDHPDGPAENEREDFNKTTTQSATPLNENEINVTANVDTTVGSSVATTLEQTVVTTTNSTVDPSKATTIAPIESTTVASSEATTVSAGVATTVVPGKATTVVPSKATTVGSIANLTVFQTTTPTVVPIAVTTAAPTVASTEAPSNVTTVFPTRTPSVVTTAATLVATTAAPSLDPSVATTISSTVAPTVAPTAATPVALAAAPSKAQTVASTATPSLGPSVATTVDPTVATPVALTAAPTEAPTVVPNVAPTVATTVAPNVSTTVATTSNTASTNITTKSFENTPLAFLFSSTTLGAKDVA